MDFFVWQGCSREFGQHAVRLRNGLRLQAQTRPARERRRHSELWQRRTTRSQPTINNGSLPDGKRRDLTVMFFRRIGITAGAKNDRQFTFL